MDVRYEVIVKDVHPAPVPPEELMAIVEDGLDVNDVSYELVEVRLEEIA